MKKCSTCGLLYSGDLCPKCMAGFAQKPTDPTAPPEDLPLRPGQTFHGLEILELLGKGGMGIVYKARQTTLDRMIALKILPQKMALDPDFQNRFIREAKALGSLNHPNIVAVYDFGAENGLFFFAMEYVDGTNLRQIMRDRRMTPEQGLKIVPQLCDALEYAHGEGVVHRDIKPENILLDKKGRVKIADFGLAKLVGADVAQAGMLTMTNMVMGTPHYMAPEQVENPKGVDHRADIYAIGVVLYEMLTGELPIGRFEIPSKKVQIDVRLDDVVLKALEKSPDRRYQKASEVKDAVTLATSIKAADSYSPTVITPMPARKGNNRPVIVMAGVTAIALILAAGAWMKSSLPPVTTPTVTPTAAVVAAAPVDLTPLYFSPEDRPGHYVYQQPGTGLPRNPMPAKQDAEIDALIKLLDNVGLQNIDRSDIKQGYISAWWRWSAAFCALETPAAERIEKSFLSLDSLKNRWTHRKGDLLVMAWTPARDYREVFNDLVRMIQKKLGLPEVAPDVPLANLKIEDRDIPKGWTLDPKPGADATRSEVTIEAPEGGGSIFYGAYLLDSAEKAKVQEPGIRKRLDKNATRIEILRQGRTLLSLALYGTQIGLYEKFAEELRSTMGHPTRTWDVLVPLPAEIPEGYTIDKVETDVKAIFQQAGMEGVKPGDVRHAWRATLKPHGSITLFETEESNVRSALKDHLSKRGPAMDTGSWACGVEGPDDVALDALENRMREKFGWDRNHPRPLHLLSARLSPGDLPADFELTDETLDRRSFTCTIKTPQGPLQVKIQETFDYGLVEKQRRELPYKPGDVVLLKDTVWANVVGPEAAWAALDQIEEILRKKMRLEAAGVLDYAIRTEQLPKGSLYLDRPPLNTPNPRTKKHASAEVTGWWQALVDPSETRIEIFQLRDAAAARAWEAGLIDARKTREGKAPAHVATFIRGSFVVSLEQQKPGEAVFTALSDILRGKLRLKKP